MVSRILNSSAPGGKSARRCLDCFREEDRTLEEDSDSGSHCACGIERPEPDIDSEEEDDVRSNGEDDEDEQEGSSPDSKSIASKVELPRGKLPV